MSRIGRKPVPVPNGVTVTLNGNAITVKGPKGELSRALHGLTRSLIANMVEGVTNGYRKQLEITGVGYKAEVRPFGLQLALGFSHPVQVKAPEGIKLTAPNPTTVVVEGASKELVGQVAAEIRKLRKPEPYKGKGVKYQGETIRRKAGKAGGK